MDLQAAFPESKGFSTTNLWYMKRWYEFYSTQDALEKLHQLGGEIQASDNQSITKLPQLVGELESSDSQTGIILQQPVGERDFPVVLGLVSWGHHIQIIAKCKTIEETLENEIQDKQ